jgi:uncharacterized protein YmfQ (DUF2313 family)
MTLVERIRARLVAKLPEGAAFRRDADSVLRGALAAMAEEFARIDTRSDEALAEAAPWESVELLPDWERLFGLPGTGSLSERQAAVTARLSDQGGCSRPFFIALAATLGYEITIEEYLPWRCGISSCIDPMVGPAWMSTWTVHYFSGANDAGLESLLVRARPAHTLVRFEQHSYLMIDGEYLTIDGERVYI